MCRRQIFNLKFLKYIATGQLFEREIIFKIKNSNFNYVSRREKNIKVILTKKD